MPFFTTETDDLEQTQVNDSEIFVVFFFDIFKKYNANLKIVFMGLTEKIFDSIYKKVYRSKLLFSFSFSPFYFFAFRRLSKSSTVR